MKLAEINNKLLEIWTKQFDGKSDVYGPIMHQQPNPKGLVFVGLNPSMSTKGWKKILKDTQHSNLDVLQLLKWPRPQNYDLAEECAIESLSRQKYDFYALHRTLAAAVNRHWEHLDLFFYRRTKQDEMEHLVLGKNHKLNDFGESQMKLFEAMLELSQPAAVIIVNASAGRLYKQQRRIHFDPTLGCYMDKFGATTFPVFISGMLTGGRALDVFSRERLFWQVAKFFGVQWSPEVGPTSFP